MTRAERIHVATGFPIADITGPCRKPEMARARYAIMLGMKDQGRSNLQVGKKLNRDASTVSYGARRGRALMADPDFSAMVDRVREALEA